MEKLSREVGTVVPPISKRSITLLLILSLTAAVLIGFMVGDISGRFQAGKYYSYIRQNLMATNDQLRQSCQDSVELSPSASWRIVDEKPIVTQSYETAVGEQHPNVQPELIWFVSPLDSVRVDWDCSHCVSPRLFGGANFRGLRLGGGYDWWCDGIWFLGHNK